MWLPTASPARTRVTEVNTGKCRRTRTFVRKDARRSDAADSEWRPCLLSHGAGPPWQAPDLARDAMHTSAFPATSVPSRASPQLRKGSAGLCSQRPEAPQEPDAELCCLAGLLVPVEGEHPSLLVLGALLTLRYLVPLLQQQVQDTSLKGSFGVTRKEMEVSPSTEQLVQVGALVHSSAGTAMADTPRVSSRGRGAAQLDPWLCSRNPWLRSEVMTPSPVTSEGNAGNSPKVTAWHIGPHSPAWHTAP